MSLFSRAFFKDLLLIYSAEFIVLVSGVAMPGLLARFAGQDQLGIYLLVRRVVGAGVHPLSLGLALSLARFLPQEGRQLGTRIRWSLLALFMASIFSLAVLWAVVNWRSAVARTLLGEQQLADYVIPLALLLFANVVHAVLYGHFRGMMQMSLANCIQILNSGIIPILALMYLKTGGLAATMGLTGLLMLLVDFLFLVPLVRVMLQTSGQTPTGWFLPALRNLFVYGIGRVPSSALLGVLFSIGAIQLAHKTTLSAVGLFILGLNFLRLGEAAIGPFGILILPRVAASQHLRSLPRVMNDIQLLLATTVTLGVFACLQAAVLNDWLLRVWLGVASPDRWLFFVPMCLGLPFYLAYELLRHPIDATSAVPYNSIALSISVAVLAAGAIRGDARSIVNSQVLAFVTLGIFTAITWVRICRIRANCLRCFLNPAGFAFLSAAWTWILRSRYQIGAIALALNELLLLTVLLAWLAVSCKRGRRLLLSESSASADGAAGRLENITPEAI
jgi:O-antigen/teichoic acid export membrane protein